MRKILPVTVLLIATALLLVGMPLRTNQVYHMKHNGDYRDFWATEAKCVYHLDNHFPNDYIISGDLVDPDNPELGQVGKTNESIHCH